MKRFLAVVALSLVAVFAASEAQAHWGHRGRVVQQRVFVQSAPVVFAQPSYVQSFGSSCGVGVQSFGVQSYGVQSFAQPVFVNDFYGRGFRNNRVFIRAPGVRIGF